MQFVNDDMDDVFRSAGEQYPLRVNTPDWDSVQGALEYAAKKQDPKQQVKGPLWLFSFLAFLFCTTFIQPTASEEITPFAQAPNTYIRGQVSEELSQNAGQTPIKPAEAPIKKKKFFTDAKQQASVLPINKKPLPYSNILEIPSLDRSVHRPLAFDQETNISSVQKNHPNTITDPEQTENAKPYQTTAIDLLIPAKTMGTVSRSLYDAHEQDKVTNKSSQTKLSSRKSMFYAGLLGSIDMTSVQMQKAKRLGHQFGVLVGYQINNRWSVESGFFADKKYYYTEGEYYKKSRAYIPPNTSITEVDGVCTMFEIPIALKYDFRSKAKGNWFATAGLSSYIMKREDYDFVYYYHNTGTSSTHSKSYYNATTNLFSVVHLSGGYSLPIGQTTSLRLEPYLKLPITGLGYGRLNFTSVGMTVGVVKKF